MSKVVNSAEYLLDQLGELSYHLTSVPHLDRSYFEKPLHIINKALGFHIGVLYKITNVIENDLLLEVITVCNPDHIRPDLLEGTKLCLNIDNPPKEFTNEVMAFKHKNVSAINIPGWGCDMVGAIYLPENLGHGYLLAGDFVGDESDIEAHEVRMCEIMCNMLSAVLMKTQFEKLASYDGLTGLMNSRTIREELEKAVQRQMRKPDASGAVILADIDFFKKINDLHGHIQGDSVLQEVGALFNAAIRKHLDVVGRYGGEEFLLIYEDTDINQVLAIVERLRLTIAGHQFIKIGPTGHALSGEWLQVTMSFGIAPLHGQPVANSKAILSLADAALYQSKAEGRNRLTLSECGITK
ncbi:MAG: GGDEF domain-containing protein [Nitrosomonadales bacterium]|jgi:diguanylate cyclase (GGDEF)-like protein